MRGVGRSRIRRCNASWYHPSRPHPTIQPVRAFRILRIQARQLHAPVRTVDELELAHVHPHVGHTGAGPGRQEEDITRTESVDYRRDLGPPVRLIAAHARQPNAVLAVGVLNQPRAIESVVGRAAQMYGVPSDSSAVCTTSLALPEIVT